MTHREREAAVAIAAALILLGGAAGYRIGAHSVPALQITIDRRPPAPIIIVSPAEYAGSVVLSNGDLEQNTFTSGVSACTSGRVKDGKRKQ